MKKTELIIIFIVLLIEGVFSQSNATYKDWYLEMTKPKIHYQEYMLKNGKIVHTIYFKTMNDTPAYFNIIFIGDNVGIFIYNWGLSKFYIDPDSPYQFVIYSFNGKPVQKLNVDFYCQDQQFWVSPDFIIPALKALLNTENKYLNVGFRDSFHNDFIYTFNLLSLTEVLQDFINKNFEKVKEKTIVD